MNIHFDDKMMLTMNWKLFILIYICFFLKISFYSVEICFSRTLLLFPPLSPKTPL